MSRDGANDGFHEAIGELMSMCVSTNSHLHSVGLLDKIEDDPGLRWIYKNLEKILTFVNFSNFKEVEINFLMQQALTSVSSLPFHLVMDTWRWKIFDNRNSTPVEEWNNEYWMQKWK